MKENLWYLIFGKFYKISEKAKLVAKNTEMTYGTTMYMKEVF